MPPSRRGEIHPAQRGRVAAGPSSGSRARLSIAVLAGLGLVDALYMLAYNVGILDSLACPFFGSGCNLAGRSTQARHLGVPNAAVGAAAYVAIGGLALSNQGRPLEQRRVQILCMAGLSLGAAVASMVLTWEQVKLRVFCFWCLLSTVINFLILPLTLHEARAAVEGSKDYSVESQL